MKSKNLLKVFFVVIGSIAIICGFVLLGFYMHVRQGWFMSSEELRKEGNLEFIRENYSEAAVWFERAAEKGDSVSCAKYKYCDRFCKLAEKGTDAQKKEFLDDLNKEMKKGDTDAYLFSGICCRKFEEKNIENANLVINYLLKSARMGNDVAAIFLSEIYTDSYKKHEKSKYLNDEEVPIYYEAFEKQIEEGKITEDEILMMSGSALSVFE